mmetsp:Transcript_65719/g.105933  ORF Transcript_65719/g.105933 Transcript_65719/m.105933 type:complete len:212 (+) Transcript_65719:166-801(+)
MIFELLTMILLGGIGLGIQPLVLRLELVELSLDFVELAINLLTEGRHHVHDLLATVNSIPLDQGGMLPHDVEIPENVGIVFLQGIYLELHLLHRLLLDCKHLALRLGYDATVSLVLGGHDALQLVQPPRDLLCSPHQLEVGVLQLLNLVAGGAPSLPRARALLSLHGGRGCGDRPRDGQSDLDRRQLSERDPIKESSKTAVGVQRSSLRPI